MRPIKLVMSAFGSYASETAIDFEKLGTKGLFVITGETGAGKTTIFDAICFALFGKASGNVREPSMFRSRYAKPDARTFVRLTFAYGGKEYTVERTPSYERLALKGSGVTEQKSTAELYLPDGNQPITKVGDVDRKIQEIIGVTDEQYRQIAMIAQGQFRDLLFAPTKDRKTIFRKIFRTERFESLQNRMKEDIGNLQAQVRESNGIIKDNIANIVVEETDAGARIEQIRQSNDVSVFVEESIKLVATIISEFENTEKEIDAKLSDNDKQVKESVALIKEAEEFKRNSDMFETKNASLKQMQLSVEESRKAMNDAKDKEPRRNSLLAEIALIDNDLKQYDELENLKNSIASNKRQAEKASSDLSHLKSLIDKSASDLSQLKDELKTLGNANAELERCRGEKTVLEVQKPALIEAKKNVDSYNKGLGYIDGYKNDLVVKTNKYKAEEQLQAEMETAFILEQAGIIASGLNDGEPCPVCGSVHHPQKASLSPNAPTQSEIDKHKEVVKNAKSEMDSASATCLKAQTRIEELKNNIEQSIVNVLDNCNFNDAMNVVVSKLGKIDERLAQIEIAIRKEEQNVSRKNNLEQVLIPKTERIIEDNKTLVLSSERNLSALTAKIESETSQHTEKSGKLKYPDKNTALTERNNKKRECDSIAQEMERTLNDFNALNEKIAGTEGELKSLSELLSHGCNINLETERTRLAALDEERKKLSERKTEVCGNRSNNASRLSVMKAKYAECKELDNELRWKTELSDTLNAKLNGSSRIDLETYVQMTYFDRIIARANRHMRTLTNCQYELKRREEPQKGAGQMGLDLDIIDHHNGSTDTVKSLSGGESFKASLSLALGLSEEIQSAAGGIKLDTMFLDEGFGTLDENSRIQATEVLDSLTEGNRLIGIISHVPELKAIPKQILVTKKLDGSSSIEIIA